MGVELLKVIVFCHRLADDKDFTERVICLPTERATYLEEELRKRAGDGLIDSVQVGRIYIEPTPRTPYEDECDKFLEKLDSVKLVKVFWDCMECGRSSPIDADNCYTCGKER